MPTAKTLLTCSVHFLHQHLIQIILCSYLAAALVPEFGLWLRQLNLGSVTLFGNELSSSLPLLMLAILLFNAGLGVKMLDLTHLYSKSSLLTGGVTMNLLTPLTFILIASFLMKLWHDSEEAQQILMGLALVASMPIAGASTAWSQNTNGNLALSLGLVLLTTFLSPLLTPLVLHSVGFITTGDYSEDLHELASGGVVSFLGIWVILPSLAGIASRHYMGELMYGKLQQPIKLFNYLILILLNYSNAALSLPQVLSQPDLDFLALILLVVTALCLTAFASGYWLANYFHADHQSRIALMFGLGTNNNGTGLVLATTALSDHPEVLLPIIFYNLVQHLVASIVKQKLFADQGD